MALPPLPGKARRLPEVVFLSARAPRFSSSLPLLLFQLAAANRDDSNDHGKQSLVSLFDLLGCRKQECLTQQTTQHLHRGHPTE